MYGGGKKASQGVPHTMVFCGGSFRLHCFTSIDMRDRNDLVESSRTKSATVLATERGERRWCSSSLIMTPVFSFHLEGIKSDALDLV